MNHELRKRFPSNSGLNADWGVCAWQLEKSGNVELWLLEDEDAGDGLFVTVSRAWDDEAGEGETHVVREGISEDEAAALLGVK